MHCGRKCSRSIYTCSNVVYMIINSPTMKRLPIIMYLEDAEKYMKLPIYIHNDNKDVTYTRDERTVNAG